MCGGDFNKHEYEYHKECIYLPMTEYVHHTGTFIVRRYGFIIDRNMSKLIVEFQLRELLHCYFNLLIGTSSLSIELSSIGNFKK